MVDDAGDTKKHANSSAAEPIVREFVHSALPEVIAMVANQPPEWGLLPKWHKSPNGFIREMRQHRILPSIDELLSSRPDYQAVVDTLASDPIIRQLFECSVGTQMVRMTVTPLNVLVQFVKVMLHEDGYLKFSAGRFSDAWQDLLYICTTNTVACKTIVVLPGLKLPRFPIRLSEELLIDQLSEDEVDRCCNPGVLRPMMEGLPTIFAESAVGLRWTSQLAHMPASKESELVLQATSEGKFGNRQPHQTGQLASDILTAIRLIKRSTLQSPGAVSWMEREWPWSGISFQFFGHNCLFSSCQLTEEEVDGLLQVWEDLEECSNFTFSIHRFCSAFDRTTVADRIVDLMIAAESLFLGDINSDRGELGNRCALRAAKFIEHPTYNQREVYRTMRSAYNVRSKVVHGGALKEQDLRSPKGENLSLSAFADLIEEFMRLALRKALAMKLEAKKLETPSFWEELLFPNDAIS